MQLKNIIIIANLCCIQVVFSAEQGQKKFSDETSLFSWIRCDPKNFSMTDEQIKAQYSPQALAQEQCKMKAWDRSMTPTPDQLIAITDQDIQAVIPLLCHRDGSSMTTQQARALYTKEQLRKKAWMLRHWQNNVDTTDCIGVAVEGKDD